MFFAANYVNYGKMYGTRPNSKLYDTGPLLSVQVSPWYIVFSSIRS